MSNDNNLITRKTLNEYLKRFNSKINKTNFRNAYIVGSTPLASDWLSDTDGGTPITPEKSKLYVIKTSGNYENFVYTYDGTSYVQPVAGANGGLVVCYANKNATTPYGSDFLIKTDGGTDVISPSQTITYLMFGGSTNYKNSLLRWNGTTYDIVLSSGGTAHIFVGATATSDGIPGLMPPSLPSQMDLPVLGNGSYGIPRTMVGATSSTDGEAGSVPKPTAADISSALFGDGKYHKIYNSANGSTIHIDAQDNTWAGCTVTISDGTTTLSGTFDNEGSYTFTDVTLWGNLTVKAVNGKIIAYGNLVVTYFGHYVCGISSSYSLINISTKDTELYGQNIHVLKDSIDLGTINFDNHGKTAYYVQSTGVYTFYVDYNGRQIKQTVDVQILNHREFDVKLSIAYVFTYQINQSNSDPATRVTPFVSEYGCDNLNYTSAKMDYDNDVFDYGSWASAFFMPKPCQLKPDITVDYYLNQDDYSKKVDGTDDPNYRSTTTDDNVMLEFPTIYFKRYTDGDYRKCIISDKKLDNDFHAYAHYDKNGKVRNVKYIAAYDACNIGSKARSISGQFPSASLNRQQEIDIAAANNPSTLDSSLEGWTPWHLADWMMIQDLLVLMGMNTNTQEVYGQGNINGYNSHPANSNGYGQLASGYCDKKGLFWGSRTTNIPVKVFGIENFWGSIWKNILGFITSGPSAFLKMTYGTEDGSTGTGFNTNGTGYKNCGSMNVGGSGGPAYPIKWSYTANGLFPTAYGGSTTTHECDGFWYNTGQTDFALVGGCSDNGAYCGAFSLAVSDAASSAYWYIGLALTA